MTLLGRRMRVSWLAGVALLFAAACGGHTPATTASRVFVLGFDGLDYDLTRQLMAAGRLPNFSRLAAEGMFAPLGTSTPPQSPVAWSTFITGRDPGSHGIFDFTHRDPATLTPYLSTTITTPGTHAIPVGPWRFPLSAGRVELLRHGRAFWDVLEAHGWPSTIIRMPANFPPSGTATVELSGMGTPDVLGGYGTFTVYTSDPALVGLTPGGGAVHTVDDAGGVVQATFDGPPQPYLKAGGAMRSEFTVTTDASKQFAKFVAGSETRLLRVGEWSDWIPIRFDVSPMQSLPAECRVLLKSVSPYFELYVNPVNLDPLAPAEPISTPSTYAGELARATGRFYTQGMPDDQKGLKTGFLSVDEFLAQSKIAFDESRRQFHYAIDRFTSGFFFYYFGDADQVSHMMWRTLDPRHPAYDPATDGPHANVIPDIYADLDAVVGETLTHLHPGDTIVVLSDHGFASWRRTFNLNAWLVANGYLIAADPAKSDPASVINDMDLKASRAYGLGLNGLYLNLQGREKFGRVAPADREALLTEISDKLLHVIDPATGVPAIAHVYRGDQVYSAGGHADITPDLIVGYAKGTRVSDESATGYITPDILSNNTSPWSGDHCMDPPSVPGILLSNRKLTDRPATLQTLAGTILQSIGIAGFPN